MSIIPFPSDAAAEDSIAEFLDTIPDVDELTDEELPALRAQVEEAIHALDAREPRNMNSEAYEVWGEMHEDLEDILDEILDRMEP